MLLVKSKPIPVTLIGGYLGSGKTTLINHLLNQEHDHRIAVLVNDFGELAIDAALIETTEDNIVSLSGGCVCCSYGNDLSNALMDVISLDMTPDQIVIEASGVAIPDAIASSVSLMPQLLVHSIIVLANAELIQDQAIDKYVGDTIERQLNSADLLVLNKIDLVENETLIDLKRWLAENWPTTKNVYVRQAQLPASIILDTIVSTKILSEKLTAGITNKTTGGKVSYTKVSDLAPSPLTHASIFNTFKVDVTEPTDANTLAALLASEEAHLLRAKGFVQENDGSMKLIQVVGRRWNVTTVPIDSIEKTGSGVVCIGLEHLADAADIRALMKEQMSTVISV